jgi:hypothetical protein
VVSRPPARPLLCRATKSCRPGLGPSSPALAASSTPPHLLLQPSFPAFRPRPPLVWPLPLLTVTETPRSAVTLEQPAAGAAKAAAPRKWGKSRPFLATVLALEGLCTLSGPDDKNTVRCELDLEGSGLSYAPGDALGLYPSNDPMVSLNIQGCACLGPFACSL